MSDTPKYTDDDLKRAAGIVEEYYSDTLQAIQENLEVLLAPIEKKVDQVAQDTDELKSDMKVVKAAVTANSRQLGDHGQRITRLENA